MQSRKRVAFWVILASLLTPLFLAACGGSSGDAGSLTVYSGRSETLVGPLIQSFKETTGIDVSVKYAGTPQLAATLLEEGGNTPADVFYAQDPGGLSAVAGLLLPLAATTLEMVPDWAASPNGVWVGVSGRARTVVYNTERLTPADLPEDLTGFADSEWKGRIGWAPSNASFQTMVTAMRAMWGEDKTLQWLEDIQANDPKVYPKNTPIVAAAAVGEIDVGLVNHYYLHRFLAEEGESFGARNYHPPAGGPGAIVMVSGVGVLSASDTRRTPSGSWTSCCRRSPSDISWRRRMSTPWPPASPWRKVLPHCPRSITPTSRPRTWPTWREPRSCSGRRASFREHHPMNDFP